MCFSYEGSALTSCNGYILMFELRSSLSNMACQLNVKNDFSIRLCMSSVRGGCLVGT